MWKQWKFVISEGEITHLESFDRKDLALVHSYWAAVTEAIRTGEDYALIPFERVEIDGHSLETDLGVIFWLLCDDSLRHLRMP